MDKKSIIGIVLIFAILVVFTLINQPSEEEVEAAKHKRDSIAQVEAEKAIAEQQQAAEIQAYDESISQGDSAATADNLQNKMDEFGAFGASAVGSEEYYSIENNLMKVTFSNKGGKISSVLLKDYKTFNGDSLILFKGPETLFGLNFFSQNRSIQTEQLYFKPSTQNKNIVVTGPNVRKGSEGRLKFNEENPGGQESIAFRLEVSPGKYMEYVYTLKYNSYMVDFDLNLNGMEQYIASNQSYLNFSWSFDVPRQERASRFGEDRNTYITYKFFEEDVDNLSQNKTDEEDLSTRVKWIGFKQLFFSSTIIADDAFPNAQIRQNKFEDNPDYLANFYADIALPYKGTSQESVGMQFYFGPNHYQTLKQYNLDLERQIYLGYAIVRPVNKFVIIPVFNFLRKYIGNFGIIILLLTVFIKIILFPFTYKSYMSQAKMKALKPEVDEINAKYGNAADKTMEKQQATMALYRKAGVNPMGGCLPMVLQFPILIAMFFFFPTSIELRGESFYGHLTYQLMTPFLTFPLISLFTVAT